MSSMLAQGQHYFLTFLLSLSKKPLLLFPTTVDGRTEKIKKKLDKNSWIFFPIFLYGISHKKTAQH
jgi:hypothetical protein